MLQVLSCKTFNVDVDPQLWLKGRMGEKITQVQSSTLGITWHGTSKGAALVASYHAHIQSIFTETIQIQGRPSPLKEEAQVRYMQGPRR